MGHRAHVCRVEEDWGTQKSLQKILGILNCLRAAFFGVGVLQNVDQRRRLLALKEVDGHHVEDEPESGVMYSLVVSSPANALALPTGTQHVNRAVFGHQVGEKGWVALVHVLRQALFKSLDGSVW